MIATGYEAQTLRGYMNTTEEQIKTVETIRDETLPHGERGEHEALTALLSEFHEMRELLEAANQILLVDSEFPSDRSKDCTLYNVGTGWAVNVTDGKFDSALDAFAEVKKQGEGK